MPIDFMFEKRLRMFLDVKQALTILTPGHRRGGAGDHIWLRDVRSDGFDSERVDPPAKGVFGISNQVLRRIDDPVAHRKIVKVLGELIDVQHDLRRVGVIVLKALINRVFQPRLEGAIVLIASERDRNRRILLGQSIGDFLEEGRLESFGVGHQLLAIRVLSREQRQDLRVGSLIVPDPVVLIQTPLVAGADPGRHLLSNWGRARMASWTLLGASHAVSPKTVSSTKNEIGCTRVPFWLGPLD